MGTEQYDNLDEFDLTLKRESKTTTTETVEPEERESQTARQARSKQNDKSERQFTTVGISRSFAKQLALHVFLLKQSGEKTSIGKLLETVYMKGLKQVYPEIYKQEKLTLK